MRNNDLLAESIPEMRSCIERAKICIDELQRGFYSPGTVNSFIDAAMQKMEKACIDLRNISEKLRPPISAVKSPYDCSHYEEIYGEVFMSYENRIQIRLNALLPHCKFAGGTQYVSDTISRLLDGFEMAGGKLPCYDRAFVAITEHCNFSTAAVFDNDNKGFKGVINALKGRLFKDDNQFELSLGLFNVIDEETYCDIYIMPFDSASAFLYEAETAAQKNNVLR